MTSKEAWNKIKEQHKLYTDVEPKMFYGVQIESIDRDLEVLDILKKYLRTSGFIGYDSFDYPLYLSTMSKEDSDKLKEWLENERNKVV